MSDMYTIEFSPQAKRDLNKLPNNILKSIWSRIQGLKSNPRPFGVKNLLGQENIYRIRQGDYRILYQIKDKQVLVLVTHVAHRKDVYR